MREMMSECCDENGKFDFTKMKKLMEECGCACGCFPPETGAKTENSSSKENKGPKEGG